MVVFYTKLYIILKYLIITKVQSGPVAHLQKFRHCGEAQAFIEDMIIMFLKNIKNKEMNNPQHMQALHLV